MPGEAEDAELIAAIARSSGTARDAERALCERYAPRILGYGLRHLRDTDRAHDLVQSVLIGLLEAARAGRVEQLEHVQRYVLGMCRNIVLRMRATQARALPLEPEALAQLAFVPAKESIDPTALMSCYDKLEAPAKQILFLSFHEGCAAVEIAERLALSAVHVRVVRHRALAALRLCLDRKKEPSA